MRKFSKVLATVIQYLLLAVCLVVLIFDISIIWQRYIQKKDLPTFFGYCFADVLTGSMEPVIYPGDLIVFKAADDYEEQDIIVYRDSEGDLITHRLIEIQEDGLYITHGDNNPEGANEEVKPENVVGKVTAILGGVGAFVEFIRTPYGMIAVICVLIAAWALTYLLDRFIIRIDKKQPEKATEGEEGEEAEGITGADETDNGDSPGTDEKREE